MNKETEELENIINQLNLTDIYRKIHRTKKNTLSSKVHMEHKTKIEDTKQASVNLTD